MYNRYRQCRELPGGLIDKGETARETAREFSEESAQCAERVSFAGIMEIEIHNNPVPIYGAFAAMLTSCSPFKLTMTLPR